MLSRLGAGQTSVVYLADHAVFERVALKLPRLELEERAVLRRMFESEVAITIRLDHPNVVAAFDGFPTGDKAFLALEYCPGGTLDQHLLKDGPLPLSEAVALIADVARGLSHAHERQVLHRDVKPANVFLTEDGRAKLGDFGTGIFVSEVQEERVGTAFYMAPEMFEGKSAGVASDIYSLGILAYEVLAGTRPFTGDSYEALMVAHHTEVPRNLQNYRRDLPSDIAKVVYKAMSRDPSGRFASAQEFAAALAAANRPRGAPVDVPHKQTTGRASRPGRPEGSAGAEPTPAGHPRASRTGEQRLEARRTEARPAQAPAPAQEARAAARAARRKAADAPHDARGLTIDVLDDEPEAKPRGLLRFLGLGRRKK